MWKVESKNTVCYHFIFCVKLCAVTAHHGLLNLLGSWVFSRGSTSKEVIMNVNDGGN